MHTPHLFPAKRPLDRKQERDMPMQETRTDNNTRFPRVGTYTASEGTADIDLTGSLSSFANL